MRLKLGQEVFVLVDAQNQLIGMPDSGGLTLCNTLQEAIDESEIVGRYFNTSDVWIKRVKLVEANPNVRHDDERP